MTKLSDFTHNLRALANELDSLLVNTTPETYQEELNKVLAKFGMGTELSDLTRA